MSGCDPFSHSPFLFRWRKPLAIIVMGGILAFILWTLPNWGEFWRNVSQFPDLWQIPTNRKSILYLTIKIVSPLLIMGIMGITVWMYFLTTLPPNEEAADHLSSEQIRQEVQAAKRTDRSTSPSMPGQMAESREGPSHARPASSGSRGYDPETPLPSTLVPSQTLREQTPGLDGISFPVKDEQPALLVDQKRESPLVKENLSIAPALQTPLPAPSLTLSSELRAASEPLISLRLLKDVSIRINVPGGGHVIVPLTLNAKRVQLLAYIAWRRGELIDRDKVLESVFGWGLSDEEATEEKLSERFESHKKLLRKKIREVIIEQINKPAGKQIIDADQVDPFMSDSGFWGLSDICRVEDLEVVETSYKVISLARKDGKLIDEIPDYVKESCDRIIASYSGDFLESLIKKYPGEFRPWQGRSSWVRKPYTHYRDYYLDALWHAAEYEWQIGQRYGNGGTEPGEANLRKQQEYFGRAAQRYQGYAMYACNSRFDSKATFGVHGEYGERVGMSERALRRCVVLLGAIGRTDLINQVWSAYITQMKSASDHRWQPSKETQADVQAAREQTNAYRFAAQIAQMSDFAERQDRVS